MIYIEWQTNKIAIHRAILQTIVQPNITQKINYQYTQLKIAACVVSLPSAVAVYVLAMFV